MAAAPALASCRGWNVLAGADDRRAGGHATITGMLMVDTRVSNALSQAARLLGRRSG